MSKARRATDNGPGINPEMTNLILFTKKHNIPEMRLPRVKGQAPSQLSDEAINGVTRFCDSLAALIILASK